MKLSISIETARSAALGNRKVIRECKLPNLVEDISQKNNSGCKFDEYQKHGVGK